MTSTEPLCGAVSYEGSPYPCTRELNHGVSANPGVVLNKYVRTHISRNAEGRPEMIWEDPDGETT